MATLAVLSVDGGQNMSSIEMKSNQERRVSFKFMNYSVTLLILSHGERPKQSTA